MATDIRGIEFNLYPANNNGAAGLKAESQKGGLDGC
jgi:hypothetical protein